MGIYINFSVDLAKIEPKEWNATFEDAVKISRAGELAVIKKKAFEGREYYAQVLAEPNEEGIFITGDLKTGDNMEGHHFPWFPEDMEQPDLSGDDILALYLSEPEKYGLTPPKVLRILFNKTQGERPHIWLLAMACVFCDAFPEATFLGGDITAGQVARAVKLAEEVLGRKLKFPVAFDAEQLLPRVREMAKGDEDLTARLFFAIYKGLRHEDFNRFVAEHFTPETLYTLYRSLSLEADANRVMREWLTLGLPFRDLARMLVSDPEGPRMKPVLFVEEILKAKLHVKEKVTYDGTELDNAKEEPDNVQMQFARFMGAMSGMRNKHIGCYIPMEQMKDACETVFGAVEAVFSEAEKRVTEDQKYQSVSEFYAKLRENSAQFEDEIKDYDFFQAKDLYDWKNPEQVIAPDLLKAVTTFVNQVRQVSAERRAEFRGLGREERLDEVTKLAGSRVVLPETIWNDIFERIMDDGFMERYIGLLGIDMSGREISDMANLFLHSALLYEFIWNKTANESNGG